MSLACAELDSGGIMKISIASTIFFYLPELYGRLLGLIIGILGHVKHFLANFRRSPLYRAESSGKSIKESFLNEFKDYYGYVDGPIPIDRLRKTEFSRLNGTLYLDHAGATLYSSTQLREALEDHGSHVYGNPHSQSDSSARSSEAVEFARKEVLDYFHASPSDYACVFTSGATAALKLVGEAFPWNSNSQFYYTMTNHNSVLGIREYALAAGATITTVDVTEHENFVKKSLAQSRENTRLSDHGGGVTYNLFAMPTECNFSGAKLPLDVVDTVKNSWHEKQARGQWMVLLDAAKGAGTSPPNLSLFPADFVVASFYKIFGYPTGLGALIIRHKAGAILTQKYFGGGTVAVSIADIDYVKRRDNIEQRLEDGTISFLSIGALRYGFAMINRVGITSIGRHTWALAHHTASSMRKMKHANGAPVCCIFGNHGIVQTYEEESQIQGPVVTFNLKRADGSWVGHREVEKVASLCRINLRTGCFCNPGACAKYLGLSNKDMQSNFEAGHVCWDDRDIISGRPTGAVRISFGYMSTFEDCQEFLHFVRKYFVETYVHTVEDFRKKDKIPAAMRLKSITVYPIKSCGGFNAESWPTVKSGLLYDREWMLADCRSTALTQKKARNMCLISTYIDLTAGMLFVRAPNMNNTLEIPLEEDLKDGKSGEVLSCRQRSKSKSYGLEVSQWFTEALGFPCDLFRKGLEETRACKWRTPVPSDLSFANEGQFLLLSEESLKDLNSRISSEIKPRIGPEQFRPNVVVSGGTAYQEDDWQTLLIGDVELPVLGGCNRCQMITVDQKSGIKNANMEPLATLASYRRRMGKIMFGVLLGPAISNQGEQILTVGSQVTGRSRCLKYHLQ